MADLTNSRLVDDSPLQGGDIPPPGVCMLEISVKQHQSGEHKMSMYDLSIIVDEKIKDFRAEAAQKQLAREALRQQRGSARNFIRILIVLLTGVLSR